MEKMLNKIKVLVVILFVILLAIIAFVGVFKKEKGVWNNLVPDYKYGMDIEGSRELRYTIDSTEEEKYVYVDEDGNVKGEVWKDGSQTTEEEDNSSEEGQAEETENAENSEETQENTEENSEDIPYTKETKTIKVTPDDKLTKENFELAKKIIQKRLKKQEISEYNIRIDDVTGKLELETGDNSDNVSNVESIISQTGKFEIIDTQTGIVLMDNSAIKNATVASPSDSYTTYLQLELTKDGAEKLKEISKKYVKTESNTDENSDSSGEDDTKYVTVQMNGQSMAKTYFDEEMTNGILPMRIGKEREEYDEFVEDRKEAQLIADELNTGVLPVTYSLETDNFVNSEVTTDIQQKVAIVTICIIAILSIILIIKFKAQGLIASILGIGFVSLYVITMRYTNALITVNSFITFILLIIMNYIFMYMFLKRLEDTDVNKAYQNVIKKFYLSSNPVIVISIVFTESKYFAINSIGMVAFWGLILIAIYNSIFTRMTVKSCKQ